MTRTRAVLTGGLVVGVLDGLDAVIFFGLRGVRPIRVFQAIASGLLGRAAFTGGLSTALLGVLLHFTIATIIAGVYVAASRKLDVLRRQPIAAGMAYGVVAWLVMNYVVIATVGRGGTPGAEDTRGRGERAAHPYVRSRDPGCLGRATGGRGGGLNGGRATAMAGRRGRVSVRLDPARQLLAQRGEIAELRGREREDTIKVDLAY